MNIPESVYTECKRYVHDELIKSSYRTTEDIRNTYDKTFYIVVSDFVFNFSQSNDFFNNLSFAEHQDAVDYISQKLIDDFRKDFTVEPESEPRFFTEDELRATYHKHMKYFTDKIREYLKEPKETRPEVEFEYKGKAYRGIPTLEIDPHKFIFMIGGQMKTVDIDNVTPIE